MERLRHLLLPLSVWRKLPLTLKFLIASVVIVGGTMLVAGQWMASRIEAGLVQSRAVSGALYMEGFLAPLVRDLGETGKVSAAQREALDRLLIGSALAERVEEIKIWSKDGTVIYSTDKSLTGKKLPSDDLTPSLNGNVTAELERTPDREHMGAKVNDFPLLEVYAPIYRSGTREVVAVGEFYERAGEFLSEVEDARRTTWWMVTSAAVVITGLLYWMVRRASNLIERQRTLLAQRLTAARALAGQNNHLRHAADEARMEASRSNEILLNRIGADIHDGPVQLLSLLLLKSSDSGSVQTLGKQVLDELRGISAGLILPELEGLELEGALRLAVRRHRDMTGTAVDEEYRNLPHSVGQPLKICLYRVVQEGLNNAFRHGGGQLQRVLATASAHALSISIVDGGPGLSSDSELASDGPRLGLGGIQNRVAVFGGEVQVRSRDQGGTELSVSIPLNAKSR
ncbi:MAG: ATP-binding protein [Mesorhizobium sp.]|nr:ATP-binding protein [Mesorhizobium sp.]